VNAVGNVTSVVSNAVENVANAANAANVTEIAGNIADTAGNAAIAVGNGAIAAGSEAITAAAGRELIAAISNLPDIANVFINLKSTVKDKFEDESVHPEIKEDVEIRRSKDLCKEEEDFLKERKEYIKEKFAKYVGVDVKEIDVNDIPVIAFAESGGGFRAMIANTGKGN
jgi:hypothetical protein